MKKRFEANDEKAPRYVLDEHDRFWKKQYNKSWNYHLHDSMLQHQYTRKFVDGYELTPQI